MTKFTVGKHTTRDGREAEIFHIDGTGMYGRIQLQDGTWSANEWTVGGYYFSHGVNDGDLVPPAPKTKLVKMAPALFKEGGCAPYVGTRLFPNDEEARVYYENDFIRLCWNRAEDVEVEHDLP